MYKGQKVYDYREKAPFEPGDLIQSITHDHSTAAFGRIFTVKECYRASNSRWRVRVQHPKFANTSYYADKFIKVEELKPMYVAIDISNNPKMKQEKFNTTSFLPSKILSTGYSIDIMRSELKHSINDGSVKAIAIFALDGILEPLEPVEPLLRYRKMR